MLKKAAVALFALTMVSGCSYLSKDYRADSEHRTYFQQEVGDTVKFALDSSCVSDEAAATLHKQAHWLEEHKMFQANIEGHCDARGTTEYNIALGAKRAEAVKNFLVKNGVEADRISTVSYGKSRPAVEGDNEQAWAQNRRAVTVLK